MSQFRQCEVVRGAERLISYLPDKYARRGKVLRLNENGVWVNGWKVVWAAKEAVDEDKMPDYHDLFFMTKLGKRVKT